MTYELEEFSVCDWTFGWEGDRWEFWWRGAKLVGEEFREARAKGRKGRYTTRNDTNS
jgi:hypothetical protein